jgi:hypothetical protein
MYSHVAMLVLERYFIGANTKLDAEAAMKEIIMINVDLMSSIHR